MRKYNNLTDSQIIEKAQKEGEREQAITMLYKKYYSSVFGLIQKLSGGREDIEEVVQDTFLKANSHLDSYDLNKRPVKGWINRIAKNCLIDRYRRKDSKKKYLNMKNDYQSLDFQANHLNPEEEAINKEKRDFLKEAVSDLPELHKSLYFLRYEKDLSYEQIGYEKDLPSGTLKSEIHRMRKTLIDKLSNIY